MTFTRRRMIRLGTRAGAVAAALAFPLLTAGPARAELRTDGAPARGAAHAASSAAAAPTLGGWNISANGNGVDILIDNATGLAGVHPLSEADFPDAESQFASGPFGSGLGAVFWPGSAGGNFGSLSAQLGIPPQLQPLTSQTNDPIKASAQYPAGPPRATYPASGAQSAAEMKATADAGGTTAEAALVNHGTSSVLGFSSARGSSTASASSTAKAAASSDLHDVSILGLIDIGSITSTANATSDGATGTGSAVTHVSGVTVLGQTASIGSDGLVLPNFANSLGPITGPLVQNAISQVISGLGVTVTEFPAKEAAAGSGYTATSGGVSVRIDPPSSAAPLLEQAASQLAPLFPSQAAIIPTLPGILQGYTMTITLGRAAASANASPAFTVPFLPPPVTTPPVTVPTTVPVSNSSGGGTVPVSAGSPAATGSEPSLSPPTTAPSGGASSSVPAPPAALISVSQPLGAGPVVLGVAAAGLLGFGLWRLGRMLLPRDVDPVCPLGHDQP